MDIRTTLHAARLSDWEALRRDAARLEPILDRVLEELDTMPEDRPTERAALQELLAADSMYGGLAVRRARFLDRVLVRSFLLGLELRELGPPAHAYRYDWVLGFMEEASLEREVRELWYPLAHGRRLGTAAGEPEHVPYYAFLPRAEVVRLSEWMPRVLRSMEQAREGWRSLLRRRGTAHEDTRDLALEVTAELVALAASGDDLLVITGR